MILHKDRPFAEAHPMPDHPALRCTAFEGDRRIATGELRRVALATWEVAERGPAGPLAVFDDASGRPIELDLRGTRDEVARRFAVKGSASPKEDNGTSRRGRGRPKLGVVAKEVTLLPRHWAWLRAQRGGASAALRRLVDEARKRHEQRDKVRLAQDRAYHFMSAMAGNQPGFEEAIRALYAGDRERFEAESEGWPEDLRDHSRKLAGGAFPRRRTPLPERDESHR